jgi:outer membrane protein assembly factor BamB
MNRSKATFGRLLRPIFILGIVAAGLRWLAAYRPHIQRVPVASRAGQLEIQGSRFAARQGRGQVVILGPGGATRRLEALAWANHRILVRLPEDIESGQVQVIQRTPLGSRKSNPCAFVTLASGLPSEPYGYQVPVQAGAPWPTFRRDHRNTGCSPLSASYNGDQPWSFQTAKGIFSTPVIDDQGVIYFGSADHFFYALHPDGSLKWKFETGEVIDSAAAIGQYDPELGCSPVTLISGDGRMLQLRSDRGGDPDGLLWSYQAELRPEVSFNRWFEGNVAVGFDGTLYAGNTNFLYYAIHPDGSLKWTYATGSNNWSQAALADDGGIFWGSTDTYIRAVTPEGKQSWKTRTLGFIAASAALGSDGTVYIGSFDSNLYSLDPNTGRVRWRFATGDHIYASVALSVDSRGQTDAIYCASTDGYCYAFRPDGSLIWKFATRMPIRSSPVLGAGPDGGRIVYFGCGDGRLYALNAANGSLRWAYDTTPDDPELADRNDLNGSPALGKAGIAIGGEHGSLWHIPYDYPLHNPQDPRSLTRLPEPATADGASLLYVTPGGNLQADFPASLPAAPLITLRLLVQHSGQPLHARLCNSPFCPPDALQASLDPPVPLRIEHSADGLYIHILPQDFLRPGQSYTLRVSGRFSTGGQRFGNLSLAGRLDGRFQQNFQFTAAEARRKGLELEITPEWNSALQWTRMSAALPTMLPSLNQIGFDYLDWIIGTIDLTPPDDRLRGRLLMWAIGGRRDSDGRLVADPHSDFTLPLSGSYQADSFMLSNRDFKMAITGISIPFSLFQVRGQLGPGQVVLPGAALFADTSVLSIPNFGPKMIVAGLANNWYQKLLVAGTYITRPYPQAGPANQSPPGILVESLDYRPPQKSSPGRLKARFRYLPGASYPLGEHRPGLLLVDSGTLEPVRLDYHRGLKAQAAPAGDLHSVWLEIPARTALPQYLRAYVILDVHPIYSQALE